MAAVFRKISPNKYQVGFQTDNGFWWNEEFTDIDDARREVHYLNGGLATPATQAAAPEMRDSLTDMRNASVLPSPSGTSPVVITLLPASAGWLAFIRVNAALDAALGT